MTKMLAAALASLAAVLAAPAHAVSVESITANGNSATVFAAAPGALSVDFAINNTVPIVLGLGVEAGDADGIGFDSVVDSFLTLNPPGNALRSLTLTLGGGATFASIGSVAPAFGSAIGSLDASSTVYTLLFNPSEPFGLVLGDTGFGGDDFGLSVAGLAPGSSFSLTLDAAVPEPASWALLIAGFGMVGARLRRRRSIAGSIAA